MKKIVWSPSWIFQKLSSLDDDPCRIANGFALGIFLATTPFIGLKVGIALIVTSVLHWNKIAAIIGIYHVNTITAPVFYSMSFLAGKWILRSDVSFHFPQRANLHTFLMVFAGNMHVFAALLIGGLVFGMPLAYVAGKLLKSHLIRKKNYLPVKSDIDVRYALVTGASRGLGREIARELARRKYNLLLVSLAGEELEETGREIKSESAVEVLCYEADLSESSAVYKITEWAKQDRKVTILVNNAGIGGTKAFDEASPEYLDHIIQINIRATSLLTRLMLPELKSHPRAYILNVASMAAFSPIAYKTVYPASKAFIWSFSRGLNEELKQTGVFVSVVHPGPMMTNPDVTERIQKQGFLGKIGLVSAERTAKIAIRQLLKHDSLILPGFLNKINWTFMKIVPIWIRLHLVSQVIKRELQANARVYALNSHRDPKGKIA